MAVSRDSLTLLRKGVHKCADVRRSNIVGQHMPENTPDSFGVLQVVRLGVYRLLQKLLAAVVFVHQPAHVVARDWSIFSFCVGCPHASLYGFRLRPFWKLTQRGRAAALGPILIAGLAPVNSWWQPCVCRV